jgi:hypothetical protein
MLPCRTQIDGLVEQASLSPIAGSFVVSPPRSPPKTKNRPSAISRKSGSRRCVHVDRTSWELQEPEARRAFCTAVISVPCVSSAALISHRQILGCPPLGRPQRCGAVSRGDEPVCEKSPISCLTDSGIIVGYSVRRAYAAHSSTAHFPQHCRIVSHHPTDRAHARVRPLLALSEVAHE